MPNLYRDVKTLEHIEREKLDKPCAECPFREDVVMRLSDKAAQRIVEQHYANVLTQPCHMSPYAAHACKGAEIFQAKAPDVEGVSVFSDRKAFLRKRLHSKGTPEELKESDGLFAKIKERAKNGRPAKRDSGGSVPTRRT